MLSLNYVFLLALAVTSLPQPQPQPQQAPTAQTAQTAYSVLFPPSAAATASDAYSNFAQHVTAVSSTLLGLGSTTGNTTISAVQAMANIGFLHESLEKIEAGKLAAFVTTTPNQPLSLIVQNTPCVLNGFTIIMNQPALARNTSILVSVIRDTFILPSILSLGQSAGAGNLVNFSPILPMLLPTAGAITTADIQTARQQLSC